MLPKQHRLPSAIVPYVLKTGKRTNYNGSCLVTIIRNSPYKRFAIIISSKLTKRVTLRNKLKRLFRESIRLQASSIKRNVDGVIIVSFINFEINYQTINNVVHELLYNAGLFDDDVKKEKEKPRAQPRSS